MKLRNVIVACAVALGSMSGAAHAAFINGGLSAAGNITNAPAAPSSSMVSQLTTMASSQGSLTSATGHMAPPFTSIGGYSFALDGTPATLFTANGFIFTVTDWGTKTVTNFSCNATQCTDGINYAGITGYVSRAGYADTLFTGTFMLSSTCNSDGRQCIGDINPTWGANFAAQGQAPEPQPVPVPGTLALLGLGLVGLGAIRRKQA